MAALESGRTTGTLAPAAEVVEVLVGVGWGQLRLNEGNPVKAEVVAEARVIEATLCPYLTKS